jgi:hypothetical protein
MKISGVNQMLLCGELRHFVVNFNFDLHNAMAIDLVFLDKYITWRFNTHVDKELL